MFVGRRLPAPLRGCEMRYYEAPRHCRTGVGIHPPAGLQPDSLHASTWGPRRAGSALLTLGLHPTPRSSSKEAPAHDETQYQSESSPTRDNTRYKGAERSGRFRAGLSCELPGMHKGHGACTRGRETCTPPRPSEVRLSHRCVGNGLRRRWRGITRQPASPADCAPAKNSA